jgi:hypothetical protein
MPSEAKFDFKGFAGKHKKGLLRLLVLIVLLVMVVVGFWFVLRDVLDTEYPLLPVASSSMCVSGLQCSGFVHPFERTLHREDLIVVEGVDARNVRANYPEE